MIKSTRTVFWLGVALLFVPFLGVTANSKAGITIAIGIALIVIARRMHYARISASTSATAHAASAKAALNIPLPESQNPDRLAEIMHASKAETKKHDNEVPFHI